MARSPHRYRGDAAEVWSRLLFGELVRAIGEDVVVRAEPDLKLPRSGRWEEGLARIRPALDDSLGSTALAVAWRWTCADLAANAWPGLPLIAKKATDARVTAASMSELAVFASGVAIVESGGATCWELHLPSGVSSVGLAKALRTDLGEVDRIADIAAAWLDRPFVRRG